MNLYLTTIDGRAVLDGQRGTITVDNVGGELKGAVATVDTAGAIGKRITATTLVFAGPSALAWRKKKNEREMYLLIEGETFSLVAKIDQTKRFEARQFAAAINSAGKQASAGIPIVVSFGVPDVVGKTADVAVGEIRRLKLGQPKFVDSNGRQAAVFSSRKWRIVGQSGVANSIVLEVEKIL